MKVLYLGPFNEELISYLVNTGEEVIQFEEKINPENYHILQNIDFIISYRYKYIIPNSTVKAFEQKIINLHISLLPWNKGADPNLWSYLENTPKGVTIHYIDKGLDTGDIIVQKEVEMNNPGETLRSSYNKLCNEIENLFFQTWPLIKRNQIKGKRQTGEGSYHTTKDKNKYMHLLDNGWDTLTKKLVGKAKEIEL